MVAAVETMAYAGEVPWHGLGNKVSEDISVDEMTIQAGLNWTVSKRAVEFKDMLGQNHLFKDRFVLARDLDNKAMSVVSGRYKPVQPKEIMEFYRDLVKLGGFKLETAGSLSDGKRIWALAKTGDTAKLLGNDQIDGYLLLATSYDGTFATLAQFTSVRVVCNNTLAMAMSDKKSRISIPHVREFKADDVKEEMGIHREAWEAFRASAEALARIKLDSKHAENVIYGLFSAIKEPETKEAIVLKNHADNVVKLFSGTGMGSDLESANGTAWGVVNAVTEYVDHWKRARSQDTRMSGAWFGEGARLKQAAWDTALELAA